MTLKDDERMSVKHLKTLFPCFKLVGGGGGCSSSGKLDYNLLLSALSA